MANDRYPYLSVYMLETWRHVLGLNNIQMIFPGASVQSETPKPNHQPGKALLLSRPAREESFTEATPGAAANST